MDDDSKNGGSGPKTGVLVPLGECEHGTQHAAIVGEDEIIVGALVDPSEPFKCRPQQSQSGTRGRSMVGGGNPNYAANYDAINWHRGEIPEA